MPLCHSKMDQRAKTFDYERKEAQHIDINLFVAQQATSAQTAHVRMRAHRYNTDLDIIQAHASQLEPGSPEAAAKAANLFNIGVTLLNLSTQIEQLETYSAIVTNSASLPLAGLVRACRA